MAYLCSVIVFCSLKPYIEDIPVYSLNNISSLAINKMFNRIDLVCFYIYKRFTLHNIITYPLGLSPITGAFTVVNGYILISHGIWEYISQQFITLWLHFLSAIVLYFNILIINFASYIFIFVYESGLYKNNA